MRRAAPAVASLCDESAPLSQAPGQQALAAALHGATAQQYADLWPALRLKVGRCSSWFQRIPIPRRRNPRFKGGPGYSCGNGPKTTTPPSSEPGTPGYGYWRRWCAPQQYAHDFWAGGPEEGTLYGARRADGLFDSHWGEGWTLATAQTFDPSRPWFKLPGLRGVWSPPGARSDQKPFTPEPGRVVNEHLHPLLSGALYERLCKLPNAPIDWCCHQPGNYTYVNFVQDVVTLERYLSYGWKCEPRATSRSRECLMGWSPAVNLAPPPVTTRTAPPRGIVAGTPAAAPGVPAPKATPVNLRCHPPGQPWNYNIVQDSITLERYLTQGWVCDPA